MRSRISCRLAYTNGDANTLRAWAPEACAASIADDLLGLRSSVDREFDAARSCRVFQGFQLIGRDDIGIGESREMPHGRNQLCQQL
jgi:hypothetical protein